MSAQRWTTREIAAALTANGGSATAAYRALSGRGVRRAPGSFVDRCRFVANADLSGALPPGAFGSAPPAEAPAGPPPDQTPTLIAERREARTARTAREQLQHALDRVERLEGVVAQYEAASAEPIRPITMRALGAGQRQACAVALLSDVHFEERVVRSAAIDNEYSPAVARERLARYFRGVEWLIRNVAHGFVVPDVLLWLGGDFISGHIHDELVETTAMPPGEAMLEVRDTLIAGIENLARIPGVERVAIPCSFGNHGRTTDRMRAATGFGHSWEWVMYQLIAERFASRPILGAGGAPAASVQVHSSRDEHQFVDALGYRLAFHHGHRIKYNGGIGGITVPLIKKVFAWDQWGPADYYHFGHFHTFIDLGRAMVNGSVIGPNAYGKSIGAAPEPAQQGFYLLDERRGKTSVSPIWVADAAPRARRGGGGQ